MGDRIREWRETTRDERDEVVIELSIIEMPEQRSSVFSDWDDDACCEFEERSVVVGEEVAVLDVFVRENVGGFGMREVSYVVVRSFDNCEARTEL